MGCDGYILVKRLGGGLAGAWVDLQDGYDFCISKYSRDNFEFGWIGILKKI
jgi:hypothetical protein